MTFDTWEVMIQPPEDYLMHFRTKGSKNGVRRYQQPDGTWTPLGLAERKKREGWGETKKERRAAKQLARAERHQARKEARMQSRAARAEKKRQKSLKGLTDAELQNKINRLKMEQEYKELKRSPILKSGMNLVNKYLENKENKEKRQMEKNRQTIELERLKTQRIQAKEATKKSYNDRKAERSKYKTMKRDVKGGLKLKRKKELKGVELAYRNTTLRGAVGKFFNNKAPITGKAAGERSAMIKKAHGRSWADSIINRHNKRLPKGYKHLVRKTD